MRERERERETSKWETTQHRSNTTATNSSSSPTEPLPVRPPLMVWKRDESTPSLPPSRGVSLLKGLIPAQPHLVVKLLVHLILLRPDSHIPERVATSSVVSEVQHVPNLGIRKFRTAKSYYL